MSAPCVWLVLGTGVVCLENATKKISCLVSSQSLDWQIIFYVCGVVNAIKENHLLSHILIKQYYHNNISPCLSRRITKSSELNRLEYHLNLYL